jgi:threonine dehydrogenase-like Zn-dependent dehydrogenase
MIENESIHPDHMVTHRFPFSKTKEAFDMVAGYKDGVMKAMIDFD